MKNATHSQSELGFMIRVKVTKENEEGSDRGEKQGEKGSETDNRVEDTRQFQKSRTRTEEGTGFGVPASKWMKN